MTRTQLLRKYYNEYPDNYILTWDLMHILEKQGYQINDIQKIINETLNNHSYGLNFARNDFKKTKNFQLYYNRIRASIIQPNDNQNQ